MAGGLFLIGCDSGCNSIGNAECEYGPKVSSMGDYTANTYGRIKSCGKSNCSVQKASGITRITCDC
jgi:hypothetical protein